jgi:hypothetical protein
MGGRWSWIRVLSVSPETAMSRLSGWFDSIRIADKHNVSIVTAQRTHWQQCRLLLSEPLAVNRGSRVHATITFTAHESRSYYIDLDMWVVPDNNINGMEQQVDERTRRRMRWNLAQQTLNYSYAEESAVAGQAAAAWKGVTSAYS